MPSAGPHTHTKHHRHDNRSAAHHREVSGDIQSVDSSVSVSEFERFVVVDSPIPDLAVGRYTRTNLDVLFTPKLSAGAFTVRSVEYHLQHSFLGTDSEVSVASATIRTDVAQAFVVDLTPHHDFLARETGVRTDLYFRSSALPVLVGPSFDYIFSATANRMPVVGAPASEADAKLATNNSDDQGVFRVMDHLPASDDWRLNSTPASGRGHSPLFRMGFRMSFAFGPVLTIPLSDTTNKSRNSNFGNPTFGGSDAS